MTTEAGKGKSPNFISNPLNQAVVRNNWSGHWIWPEAVKADRNAYAFFRREFRSTREEKLTIHITANNFYWLYLDGKFIGRGPVRSFPEYYSFDTFELNVEPGNHCLAAMVHHVGESNATIVVGRPGFLADVFACDVNLSTGDGWKCIVSNAWRKELPVLMSHFGFWEECDLRRIPNGWKEAGFDDTVWKIPVTFRDGPWKNMVERDIPLLRNELHQAKEIAAVGTWEPRHDSSFNLWYGKREFLTPDDIPAKQAACRTRRREAFGRSLPFTAMGRSYVTVDFGRTLCSGYILLKLSGCRSGQLLDISYDELLQANGAVQPKRSYVNFTDRFLLANGTNVIRTAHPRGFRYVTIDLEEGMLESVSAVEERYPFHTTEAFASSDSDLDRYYHKDALTLELNTADTFVDCPSRERVHWDLVWGMSPVMQVFGDTVMMRRSLFLHAQSHTMYTDGRINGFSPSERKVSWIGNYLAWAFGLVSYWLHSGREDDVKLLLPILKGLLGHLHGLEDSDGLINAGGYWDWAPIEHGRCLLLNNAWYAFLLETLGRHELFRSALPIPLGEKAAAIRTAAYQRFWNPERRIFRDSILPDGTPSCVYSQQANAVAVLSGICPKELRAEVLSSIVDPGRLGPLPTGDCVSGIFVEESRRRENAIVPVGTMLAATGICQAFFEEDLDVEALALIRAFWGAFDHLPTHPEVRITGCNTFHCHFQGTGVAGLLPTYVLGISPTSGGWSEALFSPHPGDLTKASGKVVTPYGELSAGWELTGGGYRLYLNLPDGVSVRVRFKSIDTIVKNTSFWEKTTR